MNTDNNRVKIWIRDDGYTAGYLLKPSSARVDSNDSVESPHDTQNTTTRQATSIMTRTIKTTNRTGTFSAQADYTPLDNETVRVDEWIWDELGILPSGTESKIIPLAQAQAEYRDRKDNGWTE